MCPVVGARNAPLVVSEKKKEELMYKTRSVPAPHKTKKGVREKKYKII
jgi:hypothetical protein